jgi:hypothetical protein
MDPNPSCTAAQSGGPPDAKPPCSSTGLSNPNREPVLMVVLEVLLPMAILHKRNVNAVLFHQVRAVLAFFAVIPIMIVAVRLIIIALFTMVVVSQRRHRRYNGRGRQERTENEIVFHVMNPILQTARH